MSRKVLDPIKTRGRPAVAAAVVNAALIFLVPLALLLLEHVRLGAAVDAATLGSSAAMLLPLAALTAWRTWVHAERWFERQTTGWQPVAEAAATALILALAYLARGILTRPADAPAYLLVYGGSALISGATVGLILRTTALLALKLHKRTYFRHPRHPRRGRP